MIDPSPCSCKANSGDGARAQHKEGARKAKGADGRDGKRKGRVLDGGSSTGGERSTEAAKGDFDKDHLPPVPWTSKGVNGAPLRGLGPVVHRLRLRSAYAQQADAWGTGEPAFTSYHGSFKVMCSPAPSFSVPLLSAAGISLYLSWLQEATLPADCMDSRELS